MYKHKFLDPDLPAINNYLPQLEDLYVRGQFTNDGFYCKKLESDLASYLKVKHCIALSNGTDALMLAYKALKVKKALVPSFTFAATVSAMVWIGVEPIFVDIDSDSLSMDIEDLKNKLSKADAIVAVNSFGQPCNIDEIVKLAQKHDKKLVFDSAPALGAEYKGKKLGGFGDVECFSLHATKALPCGEGGVIATNNDELASKIRLQRNFGIDYNQILDIGINSKMSEFHAIIGSASLDNLDVNIKKRNTLVERYKNNLSKLPISFQKTYGHSVHQLFPILTNQRDDLQEYLESKKIQTRIYYSPLLNKTEVYGKYKGQTPNAEKVYSKILCLPMHTKLSLEDVDDISNLIKEFYKCSGKN